MAHLDPISKRARTKVIFQNSKTETGSSASDKATQAIEPPILRKKRYSDKGKLPLSRRSRIVEKVNSSSNDICGNDQCNPLQDAGSSYAGVNRKKKVSQLQIQAEKSTTHVKELLSLTKKKKLNMNGESSEMNLEASLEKFSPGKEPVLALEAATPAARKRKPKAYSHDNEKKSKTNKGKSRSGLLRLGVGHLGASKSQAKYKTAGHEACPTKQDVGADMVDILLKDEVHFFHLLLFLWSTSILGHFSFLELISCVSLNINFISLISFSPLGLES